jgi:hypothetical protein
MLRPAFAWLLSCSAAAVSLFGNPSDAAALDRLRDAAALDRVRDAAALDRLRVRYRFTLHH